MITGRLGNPREQTTTPKDYNGEGVQTSRSNGLTCYEKGLFVFDVIEFFNYQSSMFGSLRVEVNASVDYHAIAILHPRLTMCWCIDFPHFTEMGHSSLSVRWSFALERLPIGWGERPAEGLIFRGSERASNLASDTSRLMSNQKGMKARTIYIAVAKSFSISEELFLQNAIRHFQTFTNQNVNLKIKLFLTWVWTWKWHLITRVTLIDCRQTEIEIKAKHEIIWLNH